MMVKITEWCLLEHCRSKNGYFHLNTQSNILRFILRHRQICSLTVQYKASTLPQVKSFGVVSADPFLCVRGIRLISSYMHIQKNFFDVRNSLLALYFPVSIFHRQIRMVMLLIVPLTHSLFKVHHSFCGVTTGIMHIYCFHYRKNILFQFTDPS